MASWYAHRLDRFAANVLCYLNTSVPLLICFQPIWDSLRTYRNLLCPAVVPRLHGPVV